MNVVCGTFTKHTCVIARWICTLQSKRKGSAAFSGKWSLCACLIPLGPAWPASAMTTCTRYVHGLSAWGGCSKVFLFGSAEPATGLVPMWRRLDAAAMRDPALNAGDPVSWESSTRSDCDMCLAFHSSTWVEPRNSPELGDHGEHLSEIGVPSAPLTAPPAPSSSPPRAPAARPIVAYAHSVFATFCALNVSSTASARPSSSGTAEGCGCGGNVRAAERCGTFGMVNSDGVCLRVAMRGLFRLLRSVCVAGTAQNSLIRSTNVCL